MHNAHRVEVLLRFDLWGTALLGLAAMLWTGGAQAAMEIEGLDNSTAPASNYDRYDNDPAWIGNPANWPGGPPGTNAGAPYVWSGVGRDPNGYWGTMISPSFIISANHFHPQVGDSIQFNYNNDPSGPSETRTVLAGEWLQTSVSGDQGDVWIGELNSPVSSNVATYPLLTLPLLTDYNNLGISTFGLSGSFPGNATTVRMGRNVIDAGTAQYYTGFDPSETGGVTNAYAFQYTFNNTMSNRGVGNDEAQVMPGDSGGPTFFLYAGGTPGLLGIHWLEGTAGSNPISIDTFAAQYATDIQTGMNQLAAANVGTNGSAVADTVKTISPLLGDFNLDGHVNAADIAAMEAALTNLKSWESTHGMNDAYLDSIGDLNGDGKVNNADLQQLITLLKTGGGSVSTVPEPASCVLLGLGVLAVAGLNLRRCRVSPRAGMSDGDRACETLDATAGI